MDWLKSYFNYLFNREVGGSISSIKVDEKEFENVLKEADKDLKESEFIIIENETKNIGGCGNNDIKIILSLDGGGMRGIVSILLLKEIQKILEYDIGIKCDLVCGTSTGGIVAISKLYSVENDELLSMYSQFGKKIFNTSPMGIINTIYNESTLFSTKEYIATLQQNFQGRTMSDRKGFVVTIAQDLENLEKNVKVFANYENPSSHLHDDSETSIVDIIRSSSGIPGLFQLYENQTSIYYDGGFQYNCNLPIALIESSTMYPGAKLLFISIGTGYCKSDVAQYYCTNENTDEKVENYLKNKQEQEEETIGTKIFKHKPMVGGFFDFAKSLYCLYKEYNKMIQTSQVLMQFLEAYKLDPNVFTYRFDVELEYNISLYDSSEKAEIEMETSVKDYIANPNSQFNRSVTNIKNLINSIQS